MRRIQFLSIVMAVSLVGCPSGGSGTDGSGLEEEQSQSQIESQCCLFFTLDVIPGDGVRELRSAVSTDGVTFEMEPEVWLTSTSTADPAVRVGSDGTWRLVTGTLNGDSAVRFSWQAGSPAFPEPEVIIEGGGIPDLIEVEGGWRLYYFQDSKVLSSFSGDGYSFQKEEGVRLEAPEGMALAADPTIARRKDGSYVMYFKSILPLAELSGPYAGSPYHHVVYRAFSPDGLTWTHENIQLIQHASVPAAYTDANGRVWIYYLNFESPWPDEKETIWVTYEEEDGSLSVPEQVVFVGGIPENTWTNNPSPVLHSN